MSLLTSLGLSPTPLGTSASIPNYGPAALIMNFIFAYGLLSSRTLKQYHGIDHNVSPREDLSKYGPAAVQSGKITQSTLDMLKRNESAHANAVENYTLLVAAVTMASHAGVENVSVNRAVLGYTLARVGYAVVYLFVGADRPKLSQLRGMFWWTGNLCCLGLLYRAGGLLSS
ncbi:MAPEG family protein [Aspergillus undulatus]|uniref:MAPEG family protein n=1 Tax=Aspergillus undulatus TaxID=1810928 RepID=UPI003CCDC496